MGIAYRCDTARRLSVSVWDGEITADERARHIAMLASDAEWGAGGLVLTDLTGVAAASRPTAQRVLDAAGAFSQGLAARVRDAKWAVVADDTSAEARRFGAYLEEEVPRLVVFDDLDSACAWLDVDALAVRRTLDGLRHELRSSGASL